MFFLPSRKLLSTGDGGMLTTRNEELDRRFRPVAAARDERPDTVRHQRPQVTFEEYLMVGFNYRMTDIQAAIGREQVKRLPSSARGGARAGCQVSVSIPDVAGREDTLRAGGHAATGKAMPCVFPEAVSARSCRRCSMTGSRPAAA